MKWAIFGGAANETPAAFNPRTARAFCEGRKAFVDGGVIGDNPFTVKREAENTEAWDKGFSEAQSGTPASQTFCAV